MDETAYKVYSLLHVQIWSATSAKCRPVAPVAPVELRREIWASNCENNNQLQPVVSIIFNLPRYLPKAGLCKHSEHMGTPRYRAAPHCGFGRMTKSDPPLWLRSRLCVRGQDQEGFMPAIGLGYLQIIELCNYLTVIMQTQLLGPCISRSTPLTYKGTRVTVVCI